VTTTQLARSTSALAIALVVAAACTGAAESAAPAASGASPAAGNVLTADDIRHVAPRPNFVGAAPERFEWSAVPGADNYTFGLWTEFDLQLVEMPNIQATAVTWPPEVARLDPGTYYWMVTAFTGKTGIATSGLAAFVVVK
jgi:hypothetical protein